MLLRRGFFCWIRLLGFVFLFCIQPTSADTVWMSNGDVLTGDIIKLDAGKLSLKTDYAGTLVLDWSFVSALDSDKSFWVSLIGEQKASLRRIEGEKTGITVIGTDGQEHSFSAAWPVAAINTDKPAIADTWELGGNLTAILDGNYGNEDDLLFGVEGKLSINDQWNKNALYWDIEVENDDGIKTSLWNIGYSYSRFLNEHWFVQAAAEQEHDSTEDLEVLTSLGGTIGYRFWETANGSLRTSAGLSQLWERYEDSDIQQDFALTWIFNYVKKITNKWRYFANSRTFFRMGGSTTLVTINQGIKISLTNRISWNLTHTLDYDSDPVGQTKKTDSRIRMGVGYQW